MSKKPFLKKFFNSNRRRGVSLKQDQLPTYLENRNKARKKKNFKPAQLNIPFKNRSLSISKKNVDTSCNSPVEEDHGMKHRTPFHAPLMFRRGSAATVKMVRRLRPIFPCTKIELEKCPPNALAPFLFNTLDYICRHPAEGQFRKCGSNLKVGDVIHKVESGFPCNTLLFRQVNDIHVIGELVKYWLRELPNPLLEDLYEPLIENDCELKKEPIVEQLQCLSLTKKMICLKLFRALKVVVENNEITRMTEKGMSIVFTPNLYTKDIVKLLKTPRLHDRSQELTTFLIVRLGGLQYNLIEEGHKFYEDEKLAFIESFQPDLKVIPESKLRNEIDMDSTSSCESTSEED